MVADPFAQRKLARVLDRVRTQIVPDVLASMSETKVTIVYKTEVDDSDNPSATDPLGTSWTSTTLEVYAAITGPSAESLESGLLVVSDYEVLVPAASMATVPRAKDAIRVDGVDHDIVGVEAHPETPEPVAYRFMVKRAV